LRVPGISKELLRKIDESTVVAFREKSVTIYDYSGKEVYGYADEGVIPVKADKTLLAKVKNKGEYDFVYQDKDIVAVQYTDSTNKYMVVAAAYDKEGHEKNIQLKWILIFSFITGILVTLISGLLFSIRLVLPIKKIANEVKEISSQNLSRRIEVTPTKDELNELSATLNGLLDRLQESFEIQRRFIANASHELSTPLTSVLSQLEITLQKDRGEREYRDIIHSVYEDVKNLTQLTRSLLEIAKASGTSGGIDLLLVRIDELLMRFPSEVKKMDPGYIIELNFDNFPEDEDELLVFGNAGLLYSAVKNIVVNACKYSENHTANLTLRFAENELLITVEDNGPGIKQEEMLFIFQPFYRGTGISHQQGFGLGLSLAYRIIKLHKGSIVAENKTTGGAFFCITLPVARSFHTL
jgi:signal transduction histidine kinase